MVGGVDSGGGRHSRANVLRSSYYIHCFGRLHLVRQAARVLRGLNSQQTMHHSVVRPSPQDEVFWCRTHQQKLTAHPDRAAYLRRLSRARRTGADNWVACQFYAPFKKICGPYKHQICSGNPLTYTQGGDVTESVVMKRSPFCGYNTI